MNALTQMVSKVAAKVAKAIIPTRRVSSIDGRQEPPSLASQMDVDRVMSVVASAESGYMRDLFSLYRDVILSDSHLQGEFTKRKLAVLGDAMTFRPADKTHAADIATAEMVRTALTGVPDWMRACSHLLDSSLYPVSIVEKVFAPTSSGYVISGLIPVPYTLIDYADGRLRLFDVDPSTGVVTGTKHDVDPYRYIVHRGHLLSAPDNWGGPMRSILFWWLLGTMSREWWARFLDRYGSPFLVGKYSDTADQPVLERAFSLSKRLGGLVVSDGTSVEIKQAAAQDSGAAYERFLAICQREKSKLILGQTLSADAQPTGLGSGTADIQEGVRQDIRKFDASMLSVTLRNQLIVQLCRINGCSGKPPIMIWGADSAADIRAATSILGSLSSAGLEVTDDAIPILSEKVGFGLQRKAAAPSPFAPMSVPSDRRSAIYRAVVGSTSKQQAVERLSAEFPSIGTDAIRNMLADVFGRG